MEAEVRALRAQISPHFIYNSLNAIASFINTDPERARELVVEFADFTRYSFRRHGDFTTLAEELRCIDRYLLLERARFGDRLQVSLRIAPEVLSTVIPFLSLQPLVENAVRHGLEAKDGPGTVTITATTPARTPRSPSRTTAWAWIRSSCGAVLAGDADGDARRAAQRRRAAAPGLRRRPRPGRRDRTRRRHPDHHARAEVPAAAATHDRRSRPRRRPA